MGRRPTANCGEPRRTAGSRTEGARPVSTQDCTSSACASAPTSVNGHGGLLLCDTASERAVTWTDGRSTFTLVSYDPQHTAMSPDELLRVASSVRAP
jgi:hypothetical protein